MKRVHLDASKDHGTTHGVAEAKYWSVGFLEAVADDPLGPPKGQFWRPVCSFLRDVSDPESDATGDGSYSTTSSCPSPPSNVKSEHNLNSSSSTTGNGRTGYGGNQQHRHERQFDVYEFGVEGSKYTGALSVLNGVTGSDSDNE